jgi:hypothetical protein
MCERNCLRRGVGAPVLMSLVVFGGISTVANGASPADDWRARTEKALDRWCRWLSGYLYQIPGTDLYTLNPTAGTGANPYRDCAGNDFAAGAAAYWMKRAHPEENVARPLRGLIKLVLGSHVAIKAVNRPDVRFWGSTCSYADNWHACLHVVVLSMLAMDALPAEQREQLRTMLAWEADHRAKLGISKEGGSIPALMPQGSCGESNAWTAALMQLARATFPDSDRQNTWRNAAIEFSLNAVCMPADMASDRVIAGNPLKGWVRGANFEPGGIQEHHGFYHPGYVGWPLAYKAFAVLLDESLPPDHRNPDVYLHNYKFVFDRLKRGTFSNGRFIHCAGDDWITYGYGNSQILPAAIFAAARFNDPDASRIADQWLSLIEHQQSLTGGAIPSARLATFHRLRVNDIAWYEGEDGVALAQAMWVLDRIDTGAVPPPSSEREFDARNVGTYHEPNARLVWHRDSHRWASFCWRSCYGEPQALVQPIGLPNLLKFNHNSFGILDIAGCTRSIEIKWFATDTLKGGGFWSLGQIDRESRSDIVKGRVSPLVRQYQALVALPEGPSILIDQCLALDQLWLLRSGSLGMRLAADIFNDNKVSLTVNGMEKVFGQHTERDTWHDLGSREITLEKVLAIHVVAGEGTFQLLQKRRRSPDRSELLYPNDPYGSEESLLTHELYFGPAGYDRPRIVVPQTWFRNDVLVFYCDPAATPPKTAAVIMGKHPCFAIHLPDLKRAVAINFADNEQSTDSPAGRITVAARSVKVLP